MERQNIKQPASGKDNTAVTKLKLQIGPYEIFPVPTGEFGLDGGAMFGTVPKVLWERSNPADDKNRIALEARALLLKSKDRNILIDCGNGGDFIAKYGEKVGSKFAEIYAVASGGNSLSGSLAAAGVSPDEITDVILTHLHFDHCGGGVTAVDGKLVPQFSKARYYVQEANLATATKPNIRERASYYSANFSALLEAKVLTLVQGDTENLLPGISVMISNGHTRGHQMVKISDGKTSLLYCGDVVPTSSHARLAWVMGYDLDPLTLIEEKNRVLGQAADNNWYLYFEHDPYCDAAKVVRNGQDFAISDRYHL
jgi:glyoxylase-like metal-dependent hydrolase (beta-lactamase superfamily II)